MGCFSSKSPQMRRVSAPQYKSADDIFNYGIGQAKINQPLAYGAREGALTDLSKGTEFYNQFQPTDFESGIAGTFYQSALEKARREAGQRASMSGIETQYPELFANAISPTIYNIGTQLSNTANDRARYSLNSRMGIDPTTVSGYYSDAYGTQSNIQTQSDYQYTLANAAADYQQALQDYENKKSGISSVSSLVGGIGGAMIGGPAGFALGSSLGGMASPMWGGGKSPVSFQDAMSVYNMFKPTGGGNPYRMTAGNSWPSTMSPLAPQPVWGGTPDYNFVGGGR